MMYASMSSVESFLVSVCGMSVNDAERCANILQTDYLITDVKAFAHLSENNPSLLASVGVVHAMQSVIKGNLRGILFRKLVTLNSEQLKSIFIKSNFEYMNLKDGINGQILQQVKRMSDIQFITDTELNGLQKSALFNFILTCQKEGVYTDLLIWPTTDEISVLTDELSVASVSNSAKRQRTDVDCDCESLFSSNVHEMLLNNVSGNVEAVHHTQANTVAVDKSSVPSRNEADIELCDTFSLCSGDIENSGDDMSDGSGSGGKSDSGGDNSSGDEESTEPHRHGKRSSDRASRKRIAADSDSDEEDNMECEAVDDMVLSPRNMLHNATKDRGTARHPVDYSSLLTQLSTKALGIGRFLRTDTAQEVAAALRSGGIGSGGQDQRAILLEIMVIISASPRRTAMEYILGEQIIQHICSHVLARGCADSTLELRRKGLDVIDNMCDYCKDHQALQQLQLVPHMIEAFKRDSQVAMRLLVLNILASLSMCQPPPSDEDTKAILNLVTQYLQKNPRFKRSHMPYHLTKAVESVALSSPKLFGKYAKNFMPQLLKLLLNKWSYVRQKVLCCLSVLSGQRPLTVVRMLRDNPILAERMTAIYLESSVKAIAPRHGHICKVVLHLCKAGAMGQSLDLLVNSTLLMAVVSTYDKHNKNPGVQQCIADIVSTVLLHAPFDYVDYIFPAVLPVVHSVLTRYNKSSTPGSECQTDRVKAVMTALLRALTDEAFDASYRTLFVDLARDATILEVLVKINHMRSALGGVIPRLCGVLG